MSDDILARIEDYVDEYGPLPLGVFMSEIADEVALLRGRVQDLQMYAEQDACIAQNQADEIANLKWKTMHVFYCPVRDCSICAEIEKDFK